MPDISTDIHLKEFSNVRFYPRQRYGPQLHRREFALRNLDQQGSFGPDCLPGVVMSGYFQELIPPLIV
jgi:hypothetical protein